MDGAIEGVGEVVTGGLIARAVEPQAGDHHGAGEACLNCGTKLVGEFCHRCGQKGDVHRSLSAFGHDLLHGVLHFEGKIWRTLPMLAWHPGQLTRRYIQGERASFVSPLALFLFSVFLTFAVINALGGPFAGDGKDAPSVEKEADLKEAQDEARAELGKLRAERARLAAARQPTAEIDRQIQFAEQGLAISNVIFEKTGKAADASATSVAAAAAAAASQPGSGAKDQERARAAPGEGSAEENASNIDLDVDNVTPTPGWFLKAVKKAKENPSLLFYKLQSNAYKFSWALIPISVPFVWLLFLHRRRYRRAYRAYDHLVFVTYSIAFMSLGYVVLTLLRPLGVGNVLPALAITLIPPVHMYRQLRGAYELSRFSALWRTFLLINFTFVALGLFFTLLLALGLLG